MKNTMLSLLSVGLLLAFASCKFSNDYLDSSEFAAASILGGSMGGSVSEGSRPGIIPGEDAPEASQPGILPGEGVSEGTQPGTIPGEGVSEGTQPGNAAGEVGPEVASFTIDTRYVVSQDWMSNGSRVCLLVYYDDWITSGTDAKFAIACRRGDYYKVLVGNAKITFASAANGDSVHKYVYTLLGELETEGLDWSKKKDKVLTYRVLPQSVTNGKIVNSYSISFDGGKLPELITGINGIEGFSAGCFPSYPVRL